MVQELDQVAAAANITAEHADGFRKRSHLDVHAAMQTEVVDGAAAVSSQHAGSMRIVDHHDGAMPFGGFHQPGQRADIAVHREHAVGDEQLAARESPARSARIFSAAATSLCGNTWILAARGGSHR